MKLSEAREWLEGKCSMTNMIPQHPFETWLVRIEEADAAKIQQAYWIVRAHSEGILSKVELKVNGIPISEIKSININ